MNIFLKQFKWWDIKHIFVIWCVLLVFLPFMFSPSSTNEEFVGMIQSGDRTRFDVEVLKQLLKLLPEKHEVCAANILTSSVFICQLRPCLRMMVLCLSQCFVFSRRWRIWSPTRERKTSWQTSIASTPLSLLCRGKPPPPSFKFISALSVACVAAVCVTSSLLALLFSYQLRIECMLLCEETASVLEMLKPKVKFMEEACHCK